MENLSDVTSRLFVGVVNGTGVPQRKRPHTIYIRRQRWYSLSAHLHRLPSSLAWQQATHPSPLMPSARPFELRETFSTDNTLIIIPKASDVHHNGTAALCWGPAWTSKGSFSFVPTHGPLTLPYTYRTVKNASSRFSSLKDKASQGVLCRRWEVNFSITHDNKYTLDLFVVCVSGSYACDVPCFAATSFLMPRLRS